MKARHKRLGLILLGIAVLSAGVWMVLRAFNENMNLFVTPTEVVAGKAPLGRNFRLGGMVEAGSLQRQADGVTVSFVITDMAKNVPVSYKGILPDLFKEGKGVIAQGKMEGGRFLAQEVLAKHDENYMPPDAAYAMKKARDAKQAAGASQSSAKDGK